MKILLIAPCSADYHNGSFVLKYLRRMGHDVLAYDYRKNPPNILGHWPLISNHWIYPLLLRGLPSGNRLLVKQALDFRPDVILVIKGESVLPESIKYIKQQTKSVAINWFPDDPHLFRLISKHNAAAYDIIFTSGADTIERYKRLGIKKVYWLGFGCDPEVHKRVKLTEKERSYYEADICFVGTCYLERFRILKKLSDFKLKFWGPHWYRPLIGGKLYRHYMGRAIYQADMVKAYSAAKIVINIHPPVMRYNGLRANMKVYEIAACGAFKLCDKTKGLEEVFTIGKEIACYNNQNDAAERAAYYIENKNKREEIALNAQKRAYREYTFEHRLKRILGTVTK